MLLGFRVREMGRPWTKHVWLKKSLLDENAGCVFQAMRCPLASRIAVQKQKAFS
jgi:hypothetical protein